MSKFENKDFVHKMEPIEFVEVSKEGFPNYTTLKVNLGIYVDDEGYARFETGSSWEQLEDGVILHKSLFCRKSGVVPIILMIGVEWISVKVLDKLLGEQLDRYLDKLFGWLKDRTAKVNSNKVIVNGKDFDLEEEEDIKKELLVMQQEIYARIMKNKK